ncbi:MAG: hypothetical protein N2423_02860 [Novosphingobium sp.]|nr:hypothetical protein [Novosphingobium sp.]
MSETTKLLPRGFEALLPFVETFAIDSASRRAEIRGEAPADLRNAFYEAASPLLAQALDYLDTRTFDEYDEADKRLLWMMLSLAHVAVAVEIQGEAEPRHASLRKFMPVTRAPADF